MNLTFSCRVDSLWWKCCIPETTSWDSYQSATDCQATLPVQQLLGWLDLPGRWNAFIKVGGNKILRAPETIFRSNARSKDGRFFKEDFIQFEIRALPCYLIGAILWACYSSLPNSILLGLRPVLEIGFPKSLPKSKIPTLTLVFLFFPHWLLSCPWFSVFLTLGYYSAFSFLFLSTLD